MATIRSNLGGGIVANNPGTTGSTLILETGQGASLPTGGFCLTLSPPGELATSINSEIVLCPFPSGTSDDRAIIRAQKGTTAKDVKAGWTATIGVYDDDVLSSSQIDMRIFKAEKTTTQSTGTSGGYIVMTWDDKIEFMGRNDFNLSDNSWTAPEDGWFESNITVNVEGGVYGGDDTMSWGIRVGSSWASYAVDNWRAFSGSGVEYPSTQIGAFPVSKGDKLTIQFQGVGTTSLNLLATSRWVGKFFTHKKETN